MIPDRGVDLLLQSTPPPLVLLEGDIERTTITMEPTSSIDEIRDILHIPSTVTSEESRPNYTTGSLRSASSHSLTGASTNTSRRDSGFSSKPGPNSRSSSKHSVPSARDLALSTDDGSTPTLSRRPQPPRRLTTSSRMQSQTSIKDAMALHQRSIQLFGRPPSRPGPLSTSKNPSQSKLPLSRPSSSSQSRPVLRSRTNTLHAPGPPGTLPTLQRSQTSDAIPWYRPVSPSPTEEVATPIVPPTTLHWTSDKTRRREYAQIDRECNGMRGLWNKIRSGVFKRKEKGVGGFYDPEKDTDSDAGSVRRYRLDLDGRERIVERKERCL